MRLISRGLAIGLLTAIGLLIPAPGLTEMSAADYRLLGLRYRQEGRYAEAIAALKRSTALEPHNLSGQVLLGWTLHLAGQDEAAEQTLLAVVYINPRSIPALNALGIVYLVRGDLLSAVVTHGWAAALAPDNAVAHYNLSLAFQRLQWYDQALAAARRAAALEPDNPHPLLALAIAHWDSDDDKAAQTAYRRALVLDIRYGDRTFLSYLDEAGFSEQQIQTAQQILASLRSS